MKKEYKKSFFQLQFLTVVALVFQLVVSSSYAAKVIDDMDYIYLNIGLELDYPLPEELKDVPLKFSGNYNRYVSAKYRKARNDIRFTPKRRGSAVMVIKNKKNEILHRISVNVQKDNLHKIAAELKDLLISVDGIEVKIYNNQVLIDGQVLLPGEMDRINKVISHYPQNLVSSLVTYSPRAQKKIAEIIEAEIGQEIGYNVTVRYAHNRFLLEGCVSTQSDASKALAIANLYTQFEVSTVGRGAARRQNVNLVTNKLVVPCESEKKEDEESQKKEISKLIQVVVHFVEMKKSFHRGFAFQWTPAIGDGGTNITSSFGNQPGVVGGVTAVLTATVSNFFPKLNWAKNFGFVRVLHNSSILIENGKKGSISTSEEIPTTTTLHNGTEVSSGSRTQAKVSADISPSIIGESDDLIQMDVSINVTSPTEGGGGANVKTIKTFIHVRDGASAVLGGLISSFLDRSYNKNPAGLAGDNVQPIINLYSGKEYNTKKSQFVVFITPSIRNQSHFGVDRIKKKFRLDD